MAITSTGDIGMDMGKTVSWTDSSTTASFADGTYFADGGVIPLEFDQQDWYLENALRVMRARGFAD
tara:strand:- start:3371 stop:3568 length:198 start_codon:yes stop_codon:yes gene_type:complete